MIKQIIAKGYAYEVNGSVYFDVKKYAEKYPYGKLSGRVIDDLLETTRELEGQEEKRNTAGFCLMEICTARTYHALEKSLGRRFSRLAY